MATIGKLLMLLVTLFAVGGAFFLAFLFASPHAGPMADVRAPSSLKASLEAALGVSRIAAPVELAQIERLMQSTFDALPRESVGRVGARSAHYIIYRFFTVRHGWRISGLESLGSKIVTKSLSQAGFLGYTQTKSFERLADVELFQDTTPSFANALERHEEYMRGFSLADVAVVIAALHQLVLDEAQWILEKAYYLNGHHTGDRLTENEARSVLNSYVIIIDSGLDSAHMEPEEHELLKQAAPESSVIGGLFEFMNDVFMNYRYKVRSSLNPFVSPQFDFVAVEGISGLLLEGFGRWQADRCSAMKMDLVAMSEPEGSGRVPYDVFNSHPGKDDPDAFFAFTESVQRLHDAQTLDETSLGQVKVLVANYVQMTSNCADTSKYFSICCVDECAGLMQDLEAHVKSPFARAEELLTLVGNLSSSTVDAPRDLDPSLADKLRMVAKQHDGLVPLHSRLFWQWLHFAFPNECPFPQVGAPPARVRSPEDDAATALLAQWSDQEVLPLEESTDPWLEHGLVICSSLMQVLGLIALLAIMFNLWGTARRVHAVAKTKTSSRWSLNA